VWRDVLAEAGVAVETVDAEHLRLRADDAEGVFRLCRLDRSVSSSQLPPIAVEPSLLSVPRMTARTAADARARGWNLVTDDGLVAIDLGSGLVERPTATASSLVRRSQTGPMPWSTYTLVRRLLAVAPATQVELARLSGVGQPRVSRVLGKLKDLALVERGADGWRPASWDGLFEWWLASYPGPEGVASFWYSLDDPAIQTAKALGVLRAVGGSDAVVSGDAAADRLAPWRRPQTSTVYVRAAGSLASAGFVSVGSAAEATLTLCAAKDPGIWLPRPWLSDGLPLADPLQVAYDLAASAATDADEAVEQLRVALRTTQARAWRIAAGGRE
jgi:hypothetical protein